MLSGDIVEPTDNLYKEGNIINKHTQKKKKKKENSKDKTKADRRNSEENKKEGTGLLVDFEV